MATPDQVGAPFRAAGALPVDHRYGGRIVAMDQLPIHALGNQYVVDGNGTVTSLPALPIGETVFLQIAATPTFTNSVRLICPGGVNYTAVAGDLVVARSNGDGIWRLYVLAAAGSVTTIAGLLGAFTLSNGIAISGNDIRLSVPYAQAKVASNQSLTGGAAAEKINFDTADGSSGITHDTTNKRFTATLAGRYEVSAAVYFNAAPSTGLVTVDIRKNGTTVHEAFYTSPNTDFIQAVSGQVTLAVTDFVEIYASMATTGAVQASSIVTRFSIKFLGP